MSKCLLALAAAAAFALSPGARAAEHELEQRPANLSLVGVDDYKRVSAHEAFELTPVMPDPIEGFNRGSLAVTKGVVDWVLHPPARGWRALSPSPVRTGVKNFAYNLGAPVRLLSLLLQGEVVDLGQETAHTLVNTTAGIAGFLDVATPLGIPTHRADTGLAFASWGFGPGFYFVIPLLGPSSGRDAVGRVFDAALSPTTYVPGVGWLFSVNALSQQLDRYDALDQSGIDFYALTRGLWTIRRRIDATGYRIPESAYASSDPEPSLGILELRVKDREFPGLAEEVWAVSPSTQRPVPFSLWLQPKSAPIVYLIPGIGAQRRAANPVALAELAYRNGYSVAVVSSPFHPEFIASGLSSLYPGFTPDDAADLYAALSAADAQLRRQHPGRLQGARLLGYSLGALQALFVAALDRAAPPEALHFERVMAVNPAVDLIYSARGFDHFYNAPLRWPEAERQERVRELAMKAFLVAQDDASRGRPLPIDRTESEFLIGLSGHATILETLDAVEQRGGEGLHLAHVKVAQQGEPLATLNAGSLQNYAQQLVVPYLREVKRIDAAALVERANLASHERELRSDPRIRAMTNADDFILGAENLAWLRQTLGPRLTVNAGGGHLGNLAQPEVQRVILDGLDPATSPVSLEVR
jgi:ABC-type transporter lipoprotein component MlaA